TLAPASGSRPSVLFAAFATLLHRYTGQPDLVAGLMSAADTSPRALRVAVDADLTFTELVERVEGAIEAERSDVVPELQAVLGIDCDPAAEGEHDVWLSARHSADGLVLKLDCWGDAEDRPMADRVLGHLERILEEAEADPHQRIGGMRLLPEAERSRIFEDGQGLSTVYPSRCLHDLIADRARETPDAIAVV